jgi:hypothetical protein
METNLKKSIQKVKFATLSKTQMANIGGGCCDMTPKERCEYDHVGRCGACDTDGTWIACA